MKNEYTNKFVFILSSDLNGQVPEWVQVFPLGLVRSTAGDFTVDAESVSSIIAEFKKQGNDMVIDYEHQTQKGIEAPAGGWVKELEDRGQDGLWARIEWTEKARGYIKNKEYRYFSPVVLVRKSDSKAITLLSIGLTNLPAMSGMRPIVNKFGNEFKEDDGMEFIKELSTVLGLDTGLTEQQVIDAVKVLKEAKIPPVHKEVLDLLDLKEDASLDIIKGKVISLKNPAGYVKAEEFKALSDRLAMRDRDELVTLALNAGKISPAQKGWAEEYALKDPTGFKAFVEAAPQVVPLQQIASAAAQVNRGPVPDDVQLSVNKMLGIDDETFKKYGGEADAK